MLHSKRKQLEFSVERLKISKETQAGMLWKIQKNLDLLSWISQFLACNFTKNSGIKEIVLCHFNKEMSI